MTALTIPRSKREIVEKIHAAWGARLESILYVGKLLLAAKEVVPHSQWLLLIKSELPFGPRTAQRLMTIAGDHRITNAAHASYLPPHWVTLCVLTRLSDEMFLWALEEGIIRPEMERTEAEKLVREQKAEEGDTPDKEARPGNQTPDASPFDQARKAYFAWFPKLSSRGRAHELELCFRALTSTFEEQIAARRAKREAAEASLVARAEMAAAIWQDEIGDRA